MKEKKVVNNKGFVLVETLIVGVFIMGIFSLLYANFFPLIGEYERYRDYDTVESTYVAHWARMIALKGLPDSIYSTVNTTGYADISDCSIYTDVDMQNKCVTLLSMNDVTNVYLTTYSTTSFKNFVKDNSSFSRSFREYIAYLPTYSKNTSKTPETGYYRVIVEYVSNNTYKYGNIEVHKENSSLEIPDIGEVIISNIGDNGSTYDDGVDTFITGIEPNNYIWYSGKLWRAVSVNNTARTVKLVTEWDISAINYSSGNSAFAGSHVEDWLNDTSIDGFLGNLRDYENFIVTDSVWDATEDSRELGSLTRPNGITTVTAPVGLLNMYEFQSSYNGTTYINGYLNNGLYWWTITPYSSSDVHYVYFDGSGNSGASNGTSYGIRPSINLKSSVKIVGGDGTESNPYRLEGDNDTDVSGTLLNTRYSGEYITFGTDENNLYRIVSHENGTGTKITSAEPLKDSSTFKTLVFDNSGSLSYSTTTTIGTFLNGEYLTNYVGSSYSNMIEDNTTWYLGRVSSGSSYKIAKYVNENGTTTTSSTTVANVGLLRYGELMSGQFDRNNNNETYWTLTPSDPFRIWFLYSNGSNFYSPVALPLGIQPSLNLKSNVVITGGTGTKSDPFTISLS